MDVEASAIASVPVGVVWKILFDEFDNISRWFTGCSGSGPIPAGEGKGRFVETKAGRLERVGDLDAAAHRMTYEISGMPFPVKRASSAWSLDAAGDGTRVAIRMSVEVIPVVGWLALPILKIALSGVVKSLTGDLARYAEKSRAA